MHAHTSTRTYIHTCVHTYHFQHTLSYHSFCQQYKNNTCMYSPFFGFTWLNHILVFVFCQYITGVLCLGVRWQHLCTTCHWCIIHTFFSWFLLSITHTILLCFCCCLSCKDNTTRCTTIKCKLCFLVYSSYIPGLNLCVFIPASLQMGQYGTWINTAIANIEPGIMQSNAPWTSI